MVHPFVVCIVADYGQKLESPTDTVPNVVFMVVAWRGHFANLIYHVKVADLHSLS